MKARLLVQWWRGFSFARRSRMARGISWLAIGLVGSRISALVVYFLLARILGPASLGEVRLVQTALTGLSFFTVFGLDSTGSRYIAAWWPKRSPDAANLFGGALVISTAFSAVTGAVIILFSSPIAANFLALPRLTTSLLVLGLWLIFQTWRMVNVGILSGLKRFDAIAKSRLLEGALLPLSTLPGALLGGSTGAVLGYTMCSGCVALFLFRSALQELRPTIRFESEKIFPVIWRYSLPVVFAGFGTMPIPLVGQTLLARSNGGTDTLGVFAAAAQLQSLVLLLPGLVGSVLLPELSSTLTSGRTRVRGFLYRAIGGVSLFACLAAAAVYVSSRFLLGLYGDEFEAGRTVLEILLLVAVVGSVNEVLRQALLATDKAWSRLASNSFYATVYLSAVWYLVPRFNAEGLATTMLLATTVHFFVQSLLVARALRSLEDGTLSI